MTRLALWLTVLTALSCSRKPTPSPAPASAPASPGGGSAVTAAAVPKVLPAVVARVNGEAISSAQLESAVRTAEARARRPIPPQERDAVYRSLLDQMVGYRLLVQEARKRKLDASDQEVEARIKAMRAGYPAEEPFQQAMAAQGLTPETLRQQQRESIEVGKLLAAEVDPKLAVSAQDVAKMYEDNKDRLHEPEAVRASHILVRVPEKAEAAEREKARARAEDLLGQLRKGADFATLARQHSQDPGSAARGGDLGFFSRGQMVPSFEQAAFGLQPGQLSGVVESPFGFHIVKAGSRRAARQVPLEEARPRLIETLQQRRRDEGTRALIQQLRTRGQVEILV